MLNNFDDLFKLNKSIEESLSKRFSIMKKNGHEEALLGKLIRIEIHSLKYNLIEFIFRKVILQKNDK